VKKTYLVGVLGGFKGDNTLGYDTFNMAEILSQAQKNYFRKLYM